MNNQTAIILCGGKGTRLGSLGKKLPKTLIKIQNKEILWYIIKILKSNNFTNIILPTGYKGNKIKKYLKKSNFNIDIKCIPTGENTNIGKRIYKILSKIESENILLLNGDAIFDINLKKIIKNHQKKNFDITFLSSEITYPYGTIGLYKNKIKDFKRNLVYDSLSIRKNRIYKAYNYSGISLIKRKILFKYKNLYKNSENFEQTFFPKVILNFKCNIVKINGFWHSIDNIKDLQIVDQTNKNNNKFYLAKKLKKN